MRHHIGIGKSSTLYTISIISFLLALHIALPTYFNSSFLSTFINEEDISFIYLIQSIITIICLLSMHNFLRKFGNYRTAIGLIALQIIVFYGIVFSSSQTIIIPLFILSLTIVNLIGFTLDIFLERNTDIKNAGNIRGHYMTITNSAWILGPLLGGMLILGNNYKGVYAGAFALLFPLLYIIHRNFSKFIDPDYKKISLINTFSSIFKNKNIFNLIITNIVLQVFYAWMTIYTPIYLYKHLGFSWSEIGIILTIMLLPFVIFQIPLGKIADKKWGEKEIMIIGYIIMGISTILLAFHGDNSSVLFWCIMLFITRIGASASEIMIETYFFKKVDVQDDETLSIFRVTRPISYLIAPIITTIGLLFINYTYLFVVIGIICLLTIIPISKIEDTN